MRRVFLTGPTASGKTKLSIELAERLGAEIVSMDSMAVYRRMNIGTAKPSERDRIRVPHHLVDTIEPWQEFSLSEYLAAVRQAEDDIAARGKVVLLVGGTPLYLTALLRGVTCGPPPDPEVRAQLENEARALGNVAFHQRLDQVDPAAAKRIHPNDLRRTIRALEVFHQTGTPISSTQVHFHRRADESVFCLDLPRADLYGRINRRTDRMFQEGLVEEVRELLGLEHELSRTARQAVGYREVLWHLEGRYSHAETIELVQRRTRQFAKRQLTWFRSLEECRFIPMAQMSDPDRAAEMIVDGLGERMKDEG